MPTTIPTTAVLEKLLEHNLIIDTLMLKKARERIYKTFSGNDIFVDITGKSISHIVEAHDCLEFLETKEGIDLIFYKTPKKRFPSDFYVEDIKQRFDKIDFSGIRPEHHYNIVKKD